MDKSYAGTIRLGRATATYDREGETVGRERDVSGVTAERIEDAAASFRGEFFQSPPPYSAKKLGGRKFYEMARRGESVPSLPKKVRVSQLLFGAHEDGRLPFSIACSSGTYIRSIASELGERLSCGAHLEMLRRTRIGPFTVSDAISLDRFEALSPSERLAAPHAVPLSRVPFPFPRVQLASLEAWKIRRGQAVPARGVEAREGDWVTLIGPSNDMLALGQVNPLAAEEHAHEKERLEDLTRQREDLERSLSELAKLRDDLTDTVERRFEETLSEVERHFEEVAATLFPGGMGRLIRVEDEDGEEPGIEIELQPAGKRITRLSLLSGGEKALGAISFLFALFLARPCPFYLLDEVEAALDDANIGRFTELLRRFAGRAQFIVVTHQKRTIEAADILYGVTMGDDGISQIVSKRLAAAPEAQALSA